MKKSLLALTLSAALAAGVTMVAQAQDQQAPQQGEQGHGRRQFDPQQRVNILAKRLGLNDDQKGKLTTIFTDMQQQMQSIRGDSSLSREDRMAKMKTLREQTDEKVNGILTDDQKQKYAAMKQQAQERMKEREGQGGGGQPNNNQ